MVKKRYVIVDVRGFGKSPPKLEHAAEDRPEKGPLFPRLGGEMSGNGPSSRQDR